MSGKSYKPRKPGTLKEAQSKLVDMCGGPAAAAKICRVSSTTLFNYTDDTEINLNKNMPVDIVAELESVSDYPFITEYLANNSGYIIYKVVEEGSQSALQSDVLETGEQVAILFREWADFIGDDGIIDKNEAQSLLNTNRFLVRVLMRMRADLIAHIDDPEVPDGTSRGLHQQSKRP